MMPMIYVVGRKWFLRLFAWSVCLHWHKVRLGLSRRRWCRCWKYCFHRGEGGGGGYGGATAGLLD